MIRCSALQRTTTFFGMLVRGLQPQQEVIRYGVYTSDPEQDMATAASSINTLKIHSANAGELPSKLQAKPECRQITTDKGKRRNSMILTRLILKANDSHYKLPGWTELHSNGSMNCEKGSCCCICRTTAITAIFISGEKSFCTATGIFGIWLYYGFAPLKLL